MNQEDKLILEFGKEDAVEDFDTLNERYRKTYDWIHEKDTSEQNKAKKENKGFRYLLNKEEPVEETEKDHEEDKGEVNIDSNKPLALDVFKILSTPDEKLDSCVKIVGEYKEKRTDPFERLVALKHELSECKKEIDEYAEIFKGNEFVHQKNDFSHLHEEISLYKSKVDAFIDYNIYNSLKEEQEKDEKEEGSVNTDNNTQKFLSNYEKNNVLMSSIISQIKALDEDMVNNIISGKNEKSEGVIQTVNYEIVAAPESDINEISSKITDLESDINKLSKLIGEWSMVRFWILIF